MKFHHLTNLPEFPKYFIEEGLNANYQVAYRPNVVKANSSFNNSKLVKIIKDKFGDAGGVYIKNEPWSIYDWHTDIKRSCSINWVLKTNPRAVTMFRTHIPDIGAGKSITYKLEEVDYTLYKPTILDTSKEHCVINPSDEERIIFSLSVVNSTYEEVKEFLCGLKIT